MAKQIEIRWLDQPKASNYPAALSYLSLDIFRASALSLLGVSNFFVERDRKKIMAGEALSPILLVRDTVNRRVIVADGYHRLCSVYGIDEDAPIPCKIA